MSAEDRVTIRKLLTGAPGLDEILGGGLPEYSFNIIAGAPGGGKTTMANQIMFTNATPERHYIAPPSTPDSPPGRREKSTQKPYVSSSRIGSMSGCPPWVGV